MSKGYNEHLNDSGGNHEAESYLIHSLVNSHSWAESIRESLVKLHRLLTAAWLYMEPVPLFKNTDPFVDIVRDIDIDGDFQQRPKLWKSQKLVRNFQWAGKIYQEDIQIQATFIRISQMISREDVRHSHVKISDVEIEHPAEVEKKLR